VFFLFVGAFLGALVCVVIYRLLRRLRELRTGAATTEPEMRAVSSEHGWVPDHRQFWNLLLFGAGGVGLGISGTVAAANGQADKVLLVLGPVAAVLSSLLLVGAYRTFRFVRDDKHGIVRKLPPRRRVNPAWIAAREEELARRRQRNKK